jgi:hypothetical protein
MSDARRAAATVPTPSRPSPLPRAVAPADPTLNRHRLKADLALALTIGLLALTLFLRWFAPGASGSNWVPAFILAVVSGVVATAYAVAHDIRKRR